MRLEVKDQLICTNGMGRWKANVFSEACSKIVVDKSMALGGETQAG